MVFIRYMQMHEPGSSAKPSKSKTTQESPLLSPPLPVPVPKRRRVSKRASLLSEVPEVTTVDNASIEDDTSKEARRAALDEFLLAQLERTEDEEIAFTMELSRGGRVISEEQAQQ